MGNKLFVEIYYDVNGKGTRLNKAKDFDGREACKYLVGGGVYNKQGGRFVFKAKSLEEAKDIARNIPFQNSAHGLNYNCLVMPDNIH